jgi:hypothetical protein
VTTSRIIERLADAFPGQDFSARTFVGWTDGPTEREVREALGDIVNGEGTFQRTLSPEFQAELQKIIEDATGEPFNEARYYEGGFRPNGFSLNVRYRTDPGYGNEQIGQLAEMVSKP